MSDKREATVISAADVGALEDVLAIKDTVDAEKPVEVTDARWPCPFCGRETKEHQAEEIRNDKGWLVRRIERRICSAPACRKVSLAVDVGEAPPPDIKPCPKCGKATKEHHDDEDGCPRRICSSPVCRLEIRLE